MGYSTYYSGHLQISDRLSDKELGMLRWTVTGTDVPGQAPGTVCPWKVVQKEESTQLPSLEFNGRELEGRGEAWIRFLIDHYFEPWGMQLHGQIVWHGEGTGDSGSIFVHKNEVMAIMSGATPNPFDVPSKSELERAARVLSREIADLRLHYPATTDSHRDQVRALRKVKKYLLLQAEKKSNA